VSHEVLYLSRADVEAVGLPMADILTAVEAGFREKGQGRVEMPPKIGIHPGGADFFHAMPGLVPAAKAAGVKWVANILKNAERGLPTISGLLILNAPDTGLPVSVMDCTWITAQRTGAASAIAAKYLGPPDPRRLAILGCGVQGRSHLEAMTTQCPSLRDALAYDRRRDAAERFAAEMADRHRIAVAVCDDPQGAVASADIIVTATEIRKDPAPVIRAEWVRPGAFCMSVDFDAQFTPEAMRGMDLLATDDVPQFEHYRAMGYFRATPPVRTDLGEVVAGRTPGRTGDRQRILSLHLGLAIADMVTAVLVYERARAQGIGIPLPL
jgi:ornithine cyclodeaminase/alanine dehydrogenase